MLVRVYGKTKTFFRCYVCKVKYLKEDGFVTTFLKKIPQTKKFTMTEEEYLVSRKDVIQKLNAPILCSIACFKDMLCFKDNLSDFTIH